MQHLTTPSLHSRPKAHEPGYPERPPTPCTGYQADGQRGLEQQTIRSRLCSNLQRYPSFGGRMTQIWGPTGSLTVPSRPSQSLASEQSRRRRSEHLGCCQMLCWVGGCASRLQGLSALTLQWCFGAASSPKAPKTPQLRKVLAYLRAGGFAACQCTIIRLDLVVTDFGGCNHHTYGQVQTIRSDKTRPTVSTETTNGSPMPNKPPSQQINSGTFSQSRLGYAK